MADLGKGSGDGASHTSPVDGDDSDDSDEGPPALEEAEPSK